ncbi:MAG: hypothetical protein ACI9JM_001813 [Halioglobus sp.]|jgi:hypothetical protein
MEDFSPLYLMHHIPKTGGVSMRNWLAQRLGMHRGFVHYGVAGDLWCMENKLPFLEKMPAKQLDGIRVVMGHYTTKATAALFPNREIRRQITLRAPAKRFISQYNHAMDFWCNGLGRPQIDFYQWFEEQAIEKYDYKDAMRQQGLTPEIAFQSQASLGPNYMCRFISNGFEKREWPTMESNELASKVNELLETFWLVGLTERLGLVSDALGQELGIPTHIDHLNRGDQRKVYLEPNDDLVAFIKENNQADFLIYDYWKAKTDAVS